MATVAEVKSVVTGSVASLSGVASANIAKIMGVDFAPVIPEGAIALWSGVLGTIPANWNLCDGTGVTPNLVAKFLRGVPAATDPGGLGGADSHTHGAMTSAGGHTHTAGSLNHSHTVNSAGDHEHTTSADRGSVASNPMMGGYLEVVGAHQHTTNTAAHSHTMDTQGAHTHTISTDDGRPPYYEGAFIQAAAGALVAVGLIIIWTGTLANIPAGWSLCDGGDSRPDLREKFVRGVNTNVTDPGGVGGGATHLHTEGNVAAHAHTENNSAGHSHTFNLYTWTHDHNINEASSGVASLLQTDSGAGDHTHANSDSIGAHNHNALGNSATHHLAHTVNPASSLPVYYDVAFIYNTAAATIPQFGILLWTGTIANIPAGYNSCDGAGGRPDLLAKFLRGSAVAVDPGGEGGSDTHIHTEVAVGNHNDHTETLAGAHQHAATDNIGDHTHTTTTCNGAFPENDTTNTQLTAGAHSHTYNNEGAHNNHVLTLAGTHDHQPWTAADTRPAFYQVAYIMKA